ncbi:MULTISPECIES: AGE family epimerase/isomerase [unclassified Caulobacter]|uniref:AGE family epimerase/isomerase n=1 Tax=unclassified Caulobacter TaxID=2648921 RepID=UPI00078183AC|nr:MULTISPECIES: AGE family epimerase/isomerase [unclassified Caulobacter]AZS23576.1 AGE family epimerase/isomerase [Caulobacter sp. FWC26]
MTDAFADAARLRDRLKTWAAETAYPIWWEIGADRSKGGFFEKIDLEGRAVDGPRRGRVLPRQIYAYAIAGELGWRGPWRAAVQHGLDFFLSAYRRADGQFRTLVGPSGEALDDTADLYDQAFAIFALAAVAKALPERAEDVRSLALVVRERLIAERKHPVAGFHQANPPTAPLQSNPHMHLFEAMLAWNEIDADPAWLALADEIAELALARFIHAETGMVREFFDLDWNPAPGVEGRICEPGHQFEWGWLLLRWGKLAGRPDATAAALKMIDDAEKLGTDFARGVAINALLDDYSVHDAAARLWPQTERIKAAVLAAETTGDAKYWEMAVSAAVGLLAYLRTPVPGLWRDKYLADETFVEEPAPASSFYHIVLAILEMDRVISAAA